MKNNIVFMTCLEKAPDYLDYKEWCFKTWKYWCDNNDCELLVWEDLVFPVERMKITWQRYYLFDILNENKIGKLSQLLRKIFLKTLFIFC